jgi:endonuclease YncB( thermonuclease family)
MKHKKVFFSVLIVLLCGLASNLYAWSGTVIKVIDGDTIKVLEAGKTEPATVRLYGIDTPERKQAYGREAKNFTAGMIAGKPVEIEKLGKDRYGRIIGLVYVNGRLLNRELIRAGLAWVYTRYCKRRNLCRELELLETTAKRTGKGLFKDKDAVRPSLFRKIKRGKNGL